MPLWGLIQPGEHQFLAWSPWTQHQATCRGGFRYGLWPMKPLARAQGTGTRGWNRPMKTPGQDTAAPKVSRLQRYATPTPWILPPHSSPPSVPSPGLDFLSLGLKSKGQVLDPLSLSPFFLLTLLEGLEIPVCEEDLRSVPHPPRAIPLWMVIHAMERSRAPGLGTHAQQSFFSKIKSNKP